MVRTKWITPKSRTEEDLEAIYDIRENVFVNELKLSVEMLSDGHDQRAEHLLVYENKLPVACGRLIYKNDDYVLGFIAVLPEYRGNAYGELVVRMLVRHAFEHGAQEQRVQARCSAQGFYEKLGFVSDGGVYLKHSVEHVDMVHHGDITGNCAQ